jgi:hypothetical protein
MLDTTPPWFIAVCAIIVLLFWIALELRQARKYGRRKHYNFSFRTGQVNEKVQAQNVDFLNPNKFEPPKTMTVEERIAQNAEKLVRSSTYGRDGL